MSRAKRTQSQLEKDVESFLVKKVKDAGGEAYKFTSPNRRFVPDRICVFPYGMVIFVECKSPEGKLHSGQVREIKRLQAKSQQVAVLSSKKDVTEFVTIVEAEINVRNSQ